MLAADLSGFTAFSARLSTLGSEGSELVARTVSALFSALLETLADWSGSLLKLSGDALTALFRGPDHVRRATAAGLALQQRMEAFQSLATPAGVFALSIRIGLASGNVVLAEVGSIDRIELLIAGATARRVMEIQRQASPGAVVVGSATYQEIAPICQAVTLSSQLYQVLSIEESAPPALPQPISWLPRHDPAWEIHALIGRIESLRPYLVDQYLERLAAGPPALAGEGDLRPVTVLFACLADAGALLENARLDDPALAILQNHVQQLWAIVERHGGTINKLDLHREGHTLIVLFGAPIAQGRDSERAVSCALALLRELGARPGDGEAAAPLRVRRVGLATGRVFAGAVGSANRREYTVMGSVANLAARLMDVAADGQALIDVATARVVGQLVQLQKQPPVLVKGYDQPVPFYLVEANQPPRLSSLLRDQAPLVGRAAELAQAQAAVARALSRRGGVVALVGEAGIGKSRLLAEIARSSLVAASPPVVVVVAQAQPHSRVQPYSVIAEVFRQLYDLPSQSEAAASSLIVQARRATPGQERFLPLLPTLFGMPGEESPLTQALTSDERRARLQDLVIDLLLGRARTAPLALVLEDLHWADSASAEMLGALALASHASPLLLLGTYRTEEAPAWPAEANIVSIELRPLAPEQSQALITSWMGPVALSDNLRAAVIERTLGNPFFIEEITRALRERDVAIGNEPPLPATIQGALLARLDKLPLEERYVLQTASVIGPLFDRALLARVTGDRVALGQTLERLGELALVRPVGENRYAFTHSLTQETAYESLLFAQRRELHHQIAQQLHSSDGGEIDLGVLAYHYRRAEDWPEALEYAWQAGLRTQSLYASEIAIGHYRQALEAASRIGGAAAARRPGILRRIGGLHALAGRYADAIEAYTSALESSAEARERAEVLIAWAELCEQRAAYDDALALLDQAARLTTVDDEALELRIKVRRGWVLSRRGSADEARMAIEPYLDQLEIQQRWEDLLLAYKIFFQIALDQSRWREAHSYLRLALDCAQKTGDIREIARIYNNLGVVLGQEGALHDSAKSFEQAAQAMEEIGDQYNLALFKSNIGGIYYKLGDFSTALEHYHNSLRIATAIGNLSIESTVHSNLGELYRRLREPSKSLDHLVRSVELCRQIDDDLGLTEAYRQLAETYMVLEQLSDAQSAADQAYSTAIAAGDLQSEAIAYRVLGLLAVQRGDYESALEHASRSIRMLTELGSTHELGQSLMIQAMILAQDGQPSAAYHVLEEAIQLLERSGAIADLAEAQQLINQLRIYT